MKFKPTFIFTLLLLMVFTQLFAQDDKKKHSHKNKLSIGVMASPDIYLFNFKTKGFAVPTYNMLFNYSLGGTIIYHPVKIITLRAAFLYTTKGYSVDYSTDISNPATFNPDLQVKNQQFNLKYLDIPLMMNLNLIHKDHIQIFVSAGIIPSVLLEKSGENIQVDGTKKASNLDNVSTLLAGASYSIGVKYNVTEWLGLGFEPYYRTYFNRFDTNAMDIAPISFGGKFSTVINFNHY